MRASSISLYLLAACGGSRHDSACTDDLAAYAVWLTLTDAVDGTPLLDGSAAYTLGDEAPRGCDPLGGGDFICGWEVAGEITISAEAPGYTPASQVLAVEQGPCHVRSQSVVLVLEPVSGR